jgi:hypothetical protein
MQTIFVAAPGLQSIDSWLPLALERKEECNDKVFIVFPYLWVLELASENDPLLRIIDDKKFRVACKFFPFQFYIAFRSLKSLMRYVRMIENFKNVFRQEQRSKTSLLIRICSFLKGLAGLIYIYEFKLFRFESRGLMVWDILNLNPEPYKRLRSLIQHTQFWNRVSINVGAIYVEDVSLGVLKATDMDYQISFSKQQSEAMTLQYGFGSQKVIESVVPKFEQSWINYLETYSSIDYKSCSPYGLFISRGADAPLLDSIQRLDILEEVIKQVCEVRLMLLFIKLHPNEHQATFDFDLAEIAKRGVVSNTALSRVKLVDDHVIVAARYAKFGIAYYSSTIADMVRVGCPAIQMLPILPTDSEILVKKKLLFDLGFLEIATTPKMLITIINKLETNRDQITTKQREAWANYFFSNPKITISNLIEKFSETKAN